MLFLTVLSGWSLGQLVILPSLGLLLDLGTAAVPALLTPRGVRTLHGLHWRHPQQLACPLGSPAVAGCLD